MINNNYIKPGDLFTSDMRLTTLFNWVDGRRCSIYEKIDFSQIWSAAVQVDDDLFLFLEEAKFNDNEVKFNHTKLWKVLCKSGTCYIFITPNCLQFFHKVT
jgi:hypothetical protein